MNLVGIDWSREALRAYRLDAESRPVDRRDSRDGLRRAAKRGYEETLFRHVGPWLDTDTVLVMSTSAADRRTWVETSFLSDSCDLPQLLGAATRRRLRGATVMALPGIARRTPGSMDLMRREILIALGATAILDRDSIAAAESIDEDEKPDRHDAGEPARGAEAVADRKQRLFVLPGERSRWVRVVDGRIVDFRTSMGGELLSVLLDGPFGKAMPDQGVDDEPAFLAGVEQGYSSRHFVTDLHAERAARVLDERDPTVARPHLSGLIIGNEVREAEASMRATGEALTLVGDEHEYLPYSLALRHLGTTVAVISRDDALIAGFGHAQSLLDAPVRQAGPGHTAASPGRMAGMNFRSASPPAISIPRDNALSGTGSIAINAFDPAEDSADEDKPVEEIVRVEAANETKLERDTVEEPIPFGAGSRSWADAFDELPLIAALERLEPALAIQATQIVMEAGFRIVVLPAHMPEALATIALLTEHFGADVCVGVADAPSPKWVTSAIDNGARAFLSNGTDATIARRCRKRAVAWIPGVATVTEATAARTLGARALLLYPAEMIEPHVVRALDRALADDLPLIPSGGVTAERLLPYVAAGATGAVADTAIYKPGSTPATVAASATKFVQAWRRADGMRRRISELQK